MSEAQATPPFTLGIDLGTSAVKIVALGFDDELIGEGTAQFDTCCRLPLQAEQSPSDWLHALSSAMLALKESAAKARGTSGQWNPAAIGVTGQLPTLVCLSDQSPAAPAITWKDGRADEWTSSRLDSKCLAHLYARTGMPIDGRYLAPMLQFHFGDRLEQITSVLSAKDYLLYALTGSRLTEPSTAAGYGVYDLHEQCFSDELSRFWNLPRRLLPRIAPANSWAGLLSAAGAAILGVRNGIPVSTGAADSVCASYAMAGLDERVVSISFGSSAVVIGACAAICLDPAARYLVTPHVSDHWFGREMDLLATGTGYRWLTELFGWSEGRIDAEARGSVPGAHGLFFPPYLAGGEQGALWNPRLKGALFGMTVQHSRADIARAYLEGVFYEIKRCVDVLSEAAPVDSVTVSGNIVGSPSTLQLLADILNRPVSAFQLKSPSAVGAALLARPLTGAGINEPAPLAPVARPKLPAEVYASLYQEYLRRAGQCE